MFEIIVLLIIIANIASFFLMGVARGAVIGLLVLLLGAGLFCLFKTKIYKNYYFWFTVFGLGAFFRLLYGAFSQTPLESDMLLCYNSATSVLRGDLSWLDLPYFKAWSYQIPFVYYEASILWLFKSVRALYIFDALWGVLISVLICLIVKRLSNSVMIALISSSLYIWLPSSVLKSGLLYNFSLAGVFLLLGIYCYIIALEKLKNSKNHFSFIILSFVSGILISLSCLFRQEGIIVILACLCYYVYFLFENIKNAQKKKLFVIDLLVSFCTMVFGYMLMVFMAINCFEMAGITTHGLGNNCPYWKIVVGLTPDNNGQYSDKYVWICNVLNPDEQKTAFKKIIGEIFSGKSPLDIIWFFIKKNYYMWGSIDSGFGIPYNTIADRTFTIGYLAIDKFFYLIVLGLSFLGVKQKRRKDDKTACLFYICFIGFFLSFFIFEAGARYRYDPMIILTITSIYGLIYLKQKLQSNRI